MDKTPKIILYTISIAICLLLCNQAIHLHHIYQQEKKIFAYKLDSQKDIQTITRQADYDIRDSKRSTSLQFVLTDSIPATPEYIDTLGFLTRNILYARSSSATTGHSTRATRKPKDTGWDSTNPAKSSSPTGVKSTSTAPPATVQPSPSPYREQPKDKNTD